MSAPTPAPGDDRPREGYYPDPSIPGYVRYWNGAAWVPGTSRPAPSDGTPPAPPGGNAGTAASPGGDAGGAVPPGSGLGMGTGGAVPPGSGSGVGAGGAVSPGSGSGGTGGAVPPVEETGPHFFDEDPQPQASPADAQHGSRPEPASAWGADRGRQSGFGGDQDRRVSWGAPTGPDPRVPSETSSTDGTATIPPAQGASDVPSGNTFVFRRPTTGQQGGSGQGTAGSGGAGSGAAGASSGPAFGAPGAAGRGAGGPGAGGPGSSGSGSSGSPGPGASGGPAFGAPPSGSPAGSDPAAGRPGGTATPGVPAPGGPVGDEGTMTFRAVSPRTAQQGGAQGGGTGGAHLADPAAGGFATPASGAPVPSSTSGPTFTGPGTPASGAPASGGPAFNAPGASASGAAASSGPSTPASGAAASGGPAFNAPSPSAPGTSTPGAPGFGAGKAAAERAAAAQAQAGAAAQASATASPSAAPTALSGPQQANPAASPAAPATPSVPQQPTPASASSSGATPMTSGPGGGQPSWAQQVHRLAGASGEDQPVVPWKPPVDDVFQAAARRQASARPAGLGKRLAARLLDTVVVLGVTAAAAVPLGTKALDHVDEKIDAAKLSGETVTVWLLDGTTSTYLGIILAVLLLFGVLYEALPTAKWGRTLGKKLLGLEVRDIEGGEPPSFGAALRRWLVYSVPGLLAIGVVGVVWGLFDKPWRQCWHDKAAHTFVAG
ncbi:RDD family protein [Streptomyces justiciae]|uniref:RDD family protein n=1 Tax=Streptomyces justiciae TaxID=2780140 RepID=UPI00187F0F80|nr:RDD family protein [Streptomyces justiciae]MBE8469472.1 RDD family protein [Streptomyces justiciae]